MSGSMRSDDRAEPNLTPILDMVFQLITFFMLVINFKTASMDMSLRLPAVGSARPTTMKGQDLLVLNIGKDGTLKVLGNQIRDIPAYIAHEARSSSLTARRINRNFQEGDDLPSLVVIRADRKTPYKHLNTVIASCQQNGYRQFSLRALNREEDR